MTIFIIGVAMIISFIASEVIMCRMSNKLLGMFLALVFSVGTGFVTSGIIDYLGLKQPAITLNEE